MTCLFTLFYMYRDGDIDSQMLVSGNAGFYRRQLVRVPEYKLHGILIPVGSSGTGPFSDVVVVGVV